MKIKKETWNKILFGETIVYSFAAIFLMYAIGAALLQGKWIMLLIAAVAFAVLSVITFILACYSD